MNRRTVLKATFLAGLIPNLAQAYDQSLIVNTMKMAPKDPAHPEKAELKHLPEIKLGDVDAKGYTLVEVNVGQAGIIHPSTAEHWIYEIVLYADDKKIDSASLEPVISRGYLASRVKLDGVKMLSATARCNLHGDWTSKTTL